MDSHLLCVRVNSSILTCKYGVKQYIVEVLKILPPFSLIPPEMLRVHKHCSSVIFSCMSGLNYLYFDTSLSGAQTLAQAFMADEP